MAPPAAADPPTQAASTEAAPSQARPYVSQTVPAAAADFSKPWLRRAGLPALILLLSAALLGAGWHIRTVNAERDVLARELGKASKDQRHALLSARTAEAELAEARHALADARKAPAQPAAATLTTQPPVPTATDCTTPKSILRGRGL